MIRRDISQLRSLAAIAVEFMRTRLERALNANDQCIALKVQMNLWLRRRVDAAERDRT